jgi:hypothetical protein
MATCRRFEEQDLPNWEAFGDLPHEHLQNCPDCLRSYQRYARIVGAIRSQRAPELPHDWQARVLAAVHAKQQQATPGAAPIPPRAEIGARGAAEATRSKLRRPAFAAALLAAAGVLALVVPWRAGSDLPAYAAQVLGGDSAVRGAAAARSFRPGAPLEVLLRPARAVTGKIGARAFVVDREIRELPLQIQALPKGVLKLKMSAPSAATVRDRRVTIAIVVARPDALEHAAQVVARRKLDHRAGPPPITITLELQP